MRCLPSRQETYDAVVAAAAAAANALLDLDAAFFFFFAGFAISVLLSLGLFRG